ncbi:MarR family winged helix-turn-helix transcriptional regulator [Bacillus sp. NPDC077027]|uniref:MarR family winged helix-turn-helix transcriptional regulator n=1 Tax=Bacillus sp. NPDC077027 TaxID=3390548 RepID=UPI003CFC7971
MDEEIIHFSQKIIEYSNALSAIYVKDYKNLMKDDEFTELSTRQQLILELLRMKTRTVNELAEYFSVSASAASQLVSKLELLGYVKRTINPNNRREILVDLDQRGHKFHAMIEKNQLYMIKKYYAKLPKEDLKTLLSLYEKIYAIATETP